MGLHIYSGSLVRLTCSTDRLRRALQNVKRQFWQDSVHAEEWLERGLLFARASGSKSANGDWVRDPEPSDSLKGNAEFGFAVYSSLLDFSDRHQTAIITSW